MTRRLIHESAFAVFVVALLLVVATAVGRAWTASGWIAVLTAAAWVVGWFTIPRPPALGTCSQCRGFVWLPGGDADVSGVECCKACDEAAVS